MSQASSVRHLPGKFPASEFQIFVEEALSNLPEEFKSRLENISIVIEEEPSAEDHDSHADGMELLGISRGVPLPVRSVNALPGLPDQIAIFRGPILRISSSREEAIREIRETIVHELGHYFGLSDEDMEF